MNEKFIQDLLMKDLYERGCRIMTTNFTGHGLGECDVLGISESDIISEYEIKLSRSDFKADFKKPKHEKMKEAFHGAKGHVEYTGKDCPFYHCANKFYFVCPEDLIKPIDIPMYYGLIYVDSEGRSWNGQNPKLLHNERASKELIRQVTRNLTAKFIFGCSYMNYQQKLRNDAEAR